MKLTLGIPCREVNSRGFTKVNDSINQLKKEYPDYHSMLTFLQFRFCDCYDILCYSQNLTAYDYENESQDYLRCKREEDEIRNRLFGPFLFGHEADDDLLFYLLEHLPTKDLLKVMIGKGEDVESDNCIVRAVALETSNRTDEAIAEYQKSDLDVAKKRVDWLKEKKPVYPDFCDTRMSELCQQAACRSIYELYCSQTIARMENPSLTIGKVRILEGDGEYNLWLYQALRHEQDGRPTINFLDYKGREEPLIERYKSDEIEDPEEPNTLEEIIAHSDFDNTVYPVSDYENRLLGAIYGRFAGCILGVPVENYLIDSMEKLARDTGTPFPPTEYWHGVTSPEMLHYKLDKHYTFSKDHMTFAGSDDDITYTCLNTLVLQKYGKNLTTEQIGKFWTEHLPYACTAEHAAMMGLRCGMTVDEIVNSNPNVELIGAAIRADPFGYVCAGNPREAAILAYQDARLTHKRNGIYGEMFLAAVIAASFSGISPLDAIRIGMKYIPRNCRLHKDLERAFSYVGKIRDFRQAREILDTEFFYASRVHTNNNMVAIVFAISLGDGTFTNTISNCIAIGYDNDCTGASLGSILGAKLSVNGIEPRWYENFHDEVHTYIRGYEKVRITDLVKILSDIYNK